MTRTDQADPIPVNAPVITASARAYVNETLNAGWLSAGGPMVKRFERAFAERIGVQHAVSTSSGTTALHLALATLELGPGDEVIVPDLTMFACAAAVLYTGAMPVFVDVDIDTGNLDPDLVVAAITARTKAILAVHLYGHSADMDALQAIADRHDLWLLEDAAEAHGARYRGRCCGGLGDLAAFSFYGNKIISTGEGGMLTTNCDTLALRARSLRDLAHRPGQRFVHDELGYSYRMSSLQAAVGLGQLEHLDQFLAHKAWMAAGYSRRLKGIPGMQLPIAREWAEHVHWMYTLRVRPPFPLARDALRQAMARHGIETRDCFQSCARQPLIRQRLGTQSPHPNSERWASEGLYLPSGLALTEAQLERVCAALHEAAG